MDSMQCMAYLPSPQHAQQIIGVLQHGEAFPEVNDEVFSAGEA